MIEKLPRFSYAEGLHQYLKGMSLDCSDYTNQSIYQLVAIWVFALNLVSNINYYFGITDRPKFSNLTFWIIRSLVISSGLGLFGYYKAAIGLNPEKHCSDLVFLKTDCLLFGLTVFVYSLLLNFVFAMMLKWFSTDNKKVPF